MSERTIETAATIEEAVRLGLEKLGIAEGDADIRVAQEPRKGFLGFGARPAIVEIARRPPVALPDLLSLPALPPEARGAREKGERTSENRSASTERLTSASTAYLLEILRAMGIEDARAEAALKGKHLAIELASADAARIIGKRGRVLNSLQALAQAHASGETGSYVNVQLDIEGYRARREAALISLAARMADEAVLTRREVALEPMPSHERKAIHRALSDRLDVETVSRGVEPHRKVVIEPI